MIAWLSIVLLLFSCSNSNLNTHLINHTVNEEEKLQLWLEGEQMMEIDLKLHESCIQSQTNGDHPFNNYLPEWQELPWKYLNGMQACRYSFAVMSVRK